VGGDDGPETPDQNAMAAPPVHEEPTVHYSKSCKVLIIDDHVDSAEPYNS
jgi:hypoxanthine phosphoribosyltransferase